MRSFKNKRTKTQKKIKREKKGKCSKMRNFARFGCHLVTFYGIWIKISRDRREKTGAFFLLAESSYSGEECRADFPFFFL